MEFWVLVRHVTDEMIDSSYYWLILKDEGDESFVRVQDYALSGCYMEHDLLMGGVCHNSSLYVVGHKKEGIWTKPSSNQIYRLDTSHLEQGWKKVDARLTQEKFRPHIAQLDGKLYIFESVGFCGERAKNQPVEVYDPVTGTIDLLPEETVRTSDYALLGVDHDSKHIVFKPLNTSSSHLAFYSPYNKDGNKWEIKYTCADMKRIIYGVKKRMKFAITHKTMYWVDNNHQLRAYNLEYDMISVPVYLGFISDYVSVMLPAYVDEYDCRTTFSYLYHIKDERFCFFWHRDDKLHRTFLNISNAFVEDSFVLVVSESATHTFDIPLCAGINSISRIS